MMKYTLLGTSRNGRQISFRSFQRMPQGRKVKLAQKQQRMLSAKMHEALRSFAAPLYERDEMGHLIEWVEAPRTILEMKQEELDETFVEMESQCEMMEIDMQVQTNGLETGLEQNWDVASSLLDPEDEINTNSILEAFKLLSLEEVCIRMAHFSYTASTCVDMEHSYSFYKNMENLCFKAVGTYEYPRPQLPFDVEQQLTHYCETIDEEYRTERERNARKLERRSVRHTVGGNIAFECVFPVDEQEVLWNPVLLSGISGNVELFFKTCLKMIDFNNDEKCSPSCICFSTTRNKANVLHFAAAHGNAKFITKVLFPEDAILSKDSIRSHYKIMLDRWINSAFSCGNAAMFPFDVAVYYNDMECAKALLAYNSYAESLRNRPQEMCTPCSSYPLSFYVESPVSMAIYHGNMEMVGMLQQWELVKADHYPQAFREAANAGDVGMLTKLWEMCGGDRTCFLDQHTAEKRMCSPLHIAAAAGHLNFVKLLCHDAALRTIPDAVGDLPLSYAIDNGHLAIVDFLVTMFPGEIPNSAIRSAIVCKRNKLAKFLFQHSNNVGADISCIKPMKFSIEVGNFHMAEYILKQYMQENKVTKSPWSADVGEALGELLSCKSLDGIKKVKFVIAFQLAGVKVSIVNVVKLVSDKLLAATICNSLKHSFNQPLQSSRGLY